MTDHSGSEFKFDSYSELELIECGDRFLESCAKVWQMIGSEAWTEHVLTWFRRAAPEGIRVDARRDRATAPNARDTLGEWLVDLVHTSYPRGDGSNYWQTEMRPGDDRAWSIQLALESEWGKSGAHASTFEMVLYDASKLTALRAAVKVLVSSVTSSKPRAEAKQAQDATLEDAIVILRRRTRDTAPWLWINLPNEATPVRCRYVMFGNRLGTYRSEEAAKP